MRFLVVDDSATMRRILINSLARIGYEDVIEAHDGQHALEVWDTGVDFVITDWNMPVMSGMEFVKKLRRQSDVPILMVTTRSVREDIVTASQVGVDDFVIKPFTPATLNEKINEILAAREAIG